MKNTDLIFTPNKLIINEYYLISSVQYHDIYIEYKDPYTLIQTFDNKELLVRHSLSRIIPNLPNPFLLCNRNTIVNSLYIKCIYNKMLITLINNKQFLLSRRKKRNFINTFIFIKQHLFLCKKCFCCNFPSNCSPNNNIYNTSKPF